MRLWTLHPKYLDPAGLVAAWREALLAQKVLAGGTKGYRSHPQLIRFQAHPRPLDAIGAFLSGLAVEADSRGYRFDKGKILSRREIEALPETKGQLLYEWSHLKNKLQIRSPERYLGLAAIVDPEPHPLFRVIPGEVRSWEKTGPSG